jgi:cytochrome b6-f complex iron-sulfur subunit
VITRPAIQALRDHPSAGLSRRQLLRRAVGAGVGLWFVEMGAGTIGWLWSAVTAATPRVVVGTYEQVLLRQGDLPFADGFPAYVPEARAFLVIVDPARGGWTTGEEPAGEGTTTNVRALSQRCPHLGCRPNPCLEDGWFHCPCHQSRYDRLGTKAAGERFGPAARGMDRLATSVDKAGVLSVETGKITLGPLPVALGAPGLIPPLVANGCV